MSAERRARGGIIRGMASRASLSSARVVRARWISSARAVSRARGAAARVERERVSDGKAVVDEVEGGKLASTARKRARAADAHAEQTASGILEDCARERACRGACAACGSSHALARTEAAEAAAREVARRIEESGRFDYDAVTADGRFGAERLREPEGGKMIGVLVGRSARAGERVTLKAFSGQLYGEWRVEGWAPPVGSLTHDRERYKEEHAKIQRLSERIAVAEAEEREALRAAKACAAEYEDRLRSLEAEAKAARSARRMARARAEQNGEDVDLEALEEESRRSKRVVAEAKRERDAATAPSLELAATLRQGIEEMKTERKTLSVNLQDEIWDSYSLPSLGGDVRLLRDVFHPRVASIPCGCGDCAAPKLLAWAHARGIVPESIAEMWIGASRPRDFRVHGVFYGACRDKCVPIMGHLLCPKRRTRVNVASVTTDAPHSPAA